MKEDWQPIESAPKDGTKVLVFNDDRSIYEAHWDYDKWQLARAVQHGCGCCGGDVELLTHWMPLPEPPGVTVE